METPEPIVDRTTSFVASFAVTKEVKRALDRAADLDCRKITDQVRYYLIQGLKRDGYLTDADLLPTSAVRS